MTWPPPTRVLRDQLDVSEQEFWACVRGGTKPEAVERVNRYWAAGS